MCPNSHSEGLVQGRGTRWRPLVSPAGSTLISFSVATHGSALAFPRWHWGFSSMAAAACTAWGWLECTGGCAMLCPVPWLCSLGAGQARCATRTGHSYCATSGMQPGHQPSSPSHCPALQPRDCPAPPKMATRQLGRAARSGRRMGVSSLRQGCFRKWKVSSGLSSSFPPSFPPIPCSLWGSAPMNPPTVSPKA